MATHDTSTLYELQNVQKAYGAGGSLVAAVAGVDLVLRRGEFVVIAGPSGSGKTTLLQLLGALDRPTSGLILFEGRDLRGMSEDELADLRSQTLGFIFQQFNLIPTLTAGQNVEVALAPRKLDRAARRARVAELLDQVGLSARTEHLPTQLSGGEQQRVAIARALGNDPDVLLADEPTGNLDTTTGQEIMGLLSDLSAERGLSIILITHDPAIADRGGRLIRLKDGRVEADDTSLSAVS